MKITDNHSLHRFEAHEDGKLAFADYSIEDNVLILPHVEVHPDLRGKGVAAELMEGIVEIARDRELKIRPICSYAVAYLQRHPQHADLLD